MAHTFCVCGNCKSLNKVESDGALKGSAVCGKCKTQLQFHGLVSEVGAEDFRRIVRKSDVPVIVDFWAPWCGPCKTYGPEFEKASLEVKGAVFLKVNTETEPALSAELGIRGIPCTIVYRSGMEVKREAGAMNAAQVRSLL